MRSCTRHVEDAPLTSEFLDSGYQEFEGTKGGGGGGGREGGRGHSHTPVEFILFRLKP